jgi:VWFA-related protein
MTILCLLCGLAASMPVAAEPPQEATATARPASEVVSQDTPASFKSRVNVVLVPVVVHDRQGRAVADLRREDFQLFDRGKPQSITSFTVERQARPALALDQEPSPAPGPGAGTVAPPVQPDRFVVYLFDDVHLNFGDLAGARAAAERHFDAALEPGTRTAVFSTSGRVMVDFTSDRAALHAALLRLSPQSTSAPGGFECPEVDFYRGDLIENKHDTQALMIAEQQAHVCPGMEQASDQMLEQMARSAARSALTSGERDTRLALGVLRDAVRRVSAMPGRRSILLVSPGFLTPQLESELTTILERAIQASIVINTLDARGLYVVIPGGDASESVPNFATANAKALYGTAAASAAADVLGSLADGTGGIFFHNSNNLLDGFQRGAARPESLYVLGFSPQNLKLDGRFHNLKVSLKETRGVSVQARRGYYAPTRLANAAEQAVEEIREALYSREELHEIPIGLNTQFFKPSDESARLSVLVHLDLKAFQFRKAEGRNQDNVTVVSALFDGNGNYITGIEKKIEMHLRDETLQARLASGITVKSTIDVKPGRYAIRLVVRESEGQLMAAQNGAVEIP